MVIIKKDSGDVMCSTHNMGVTLDCTSLSFMDILAFKFSW